MADRVRGINPKGKTPISDALLQAAEQLGANEDDMALVLVSDGLETCGGDPCAVAASLREKEHKPYYYRLLDADGEIVGSWRMDWWETQHGSEREPLVDELVVELVVETGILLELEI